MKKLLGIVVLGLLLSTNAYAGTLTYVCDFRGTPDQAVYEIKGNQVYEDGNLLETTFLKIDSQSVEFRHTYESYDPLREVQRVNVNVHHKVNLVTGVGFSIYKRGNKSGQSDRLKCEKI